MIKKNLDDQIVDVINEFIGEKRNTPQIKATFPNALLRNDVLNLLDIYCTVIYFPLPNERNNGFHITGIVDKNGEEKHFVYINTHQTIEKQVFTAAHELGHVWKVDEYVASKCNNLQEDMSEDIINRFAAELLMPREQFISAFESEYQKIGASEGGVSLSQAMQMILALMLLFFVPHKAVVYRLYELGKITERAFKVLIGEDAISEEAINKYLEHLLRETKQDSFLIPTNRKWIDGLSELLATAEEKHSVSKEKINNLRSLFDLPCEENVDETFEKMMDIPIKKED